MLRMICWTAPLPMAFIDPEESWVACASALQYRKNSISICCN